MDCRLVNLPWDPLAETPEDSVRLEGVGMERRAELDSVRFEGVRMERRAELHISRYSVFLAQCKTKRAMPWRLTKMDARTWKLLIKS